MDQRVALGWALHGRADDVAGRVLHGLEGSPSYEVLASIAEADRLATQVIGRWLATGQGATEEEHAKLSGPGSLVGLYPLPALVKAYPSLDTKSSRSRAGRRRSRATSSRRVVPTG